MDFVATFIFQEYSGSDRCGRSTRMSVDLVLNNGWPSAELSSESGKRT